MKKVKMFYQPKCPFCKMAFKYIDELKQEHPEFKDVVMETIEKGEGECGEGGERRNVALGL